MLRLDDKASAETESNGLAPLTISPDISSQHCYTTEYFCTPWIAIFHAYRTTLLGPDDEVEDDHTNSVECVSALAIAPIVISCTALSSGVGFFAGAARDVYHAVKDCRNNQEAAPPRMQLTV